MSRKLDLKSGDLFSRLTLIKEMPQHTKPSGQSTRRWEAQCVCGNIKEYAQGNLVNGHTKSCGCLQIDACTKWETKGTKYKLDLRNRWLNMKGRCENPSNKKYPLYGGRGIKVCKRWQDFTNFYHDMVDSYAPGLSIDRKDGNKGYTPENCRWADAVTQNRNRKTSVLVHGKCITVICRERGVNYDTLRKLRKQNPNKSIEELFDSLLPKK
jgi:hypothetical protein